MSLELHPPSSPQVSRLRRFIQVGSAVFFCLTGAGVIFGFAALKPVLIKKGLYRHLCSPHLREDDANACKEQDLRLNLMFTLAITVTNSFALPIGILLDKIGPRNTTIIGAVVFALGNFTFGVGITNQYIDTYFVGFILLAIAGPLIFLPSFHLSNAFPKQTGLVLSFITGAFDVSSVPYLLYRALDEWFGGVSIRVFFWGYLIIPLLLIIEQLAIAPKASYTLDQFIEAKLLPASVDGILLDHGDYPHPSYGSTTLSPKLTADSDEIVAEADIPILVVVDREDRLVGALFGKSVKEQIQSSYFWVLLVFLCVHMSRINYEIQTVAQQTEYYIGDSKTANAIATAFMVLLPLGGVVGIPLIGWLLDSKGSLGTSLVILVSGILYGALCMMPYATPQIIGIAIFVVLRPLMYTFLGDYSTKAFGFETFGTVYGLINTSAGIFGLVLRPIDVFAKDTLQGNYTPINIAGLLLGAGSSAMVVWQIYSTIGRVRLD